MDRIPTQNEFTETVDGLRRMDRRQRQLRRAAICAGQGIRPGFMTGLCEQEGIVPDSPDAAALLESRADGLKRRMDGVTSRLKEVFCDRLGNIDAASGRGTLRYIDGRGRVGAVPVALTSGRRHIATDRPDADGGAEPDEDAAVPMFDVILYAVLLLGYERAASCREYPADLAEFERFCAGK